MTVKIVTDNCCDLPNELLERYDIGVVPLRVRFGEKEIPLDHFNHAEFYQMMNQSPLLPNTNQPFLGDFLNEYNQAAENGRQVISIHLSSGISGTVQGAQMAAQMVEGLNIHVFDSLKASVGQGLLVLEAARMADAGADIKDILHRLTEMQRKMQCVFVVGNLGALIKGGRVSKSKAVIASALDIKPVLHVNETGGLEPYSRARGHSGARKKLLEIMGKLQSDIEQQTVGICHSACFQDAEYLKQKIQERFEPKEIIIGEIGPVIGSHVGAGTFSVFFES